MSFQHPKSIINHPKEAKKYSEDELIVIGVEYLQDLASKYPNCISMNTRRPLSCDCFKIISKTEYECSVAIARYIVRFARKTKEEQQAIVIEWMKYAMFAQEPGKKNNTPYIVPKLQSEEDQMAMLNAVSKGERPMYE